jgi:hypothetical protein
MANTIMQAKLRLRQMNHKINLSKGNRGKCHIFQFGIQVLRNVKEAYQLDMKNGNKNWENAMNEINALLFYYFRRQR